MRSNKFATRYEYEYNCLCQKRRAGRWHFTPHYFGVDSVTFPGWDLWRISDECKVLLKVKWFECVVKKMNRFSKSLRGLFISAYYGMINNKKKEKWRGCMSGTIYYRNMRNLLWNDMKGGSGLLRILSVYLRSSSAAPKPKNRHYNLIWQFLIEMLWTIAALTVTRVTKPSLLLIIWLSLLPNYLLKGTPVCTVDLGLSELIFQ